jgi:hypothetical protein
MLCRSKATSARIASGQLHSPRHFGEHDDLIRDGNYDEAAAFGCWLPSEIVIPTFGGGGGTDPGCPGEAFASNDGCVNDGGSKNPYEPPNAVPTRLLVRNTLGTPQDCYASTYNEKGAVAQRDVTYIVVDQADHEVYGVLIREELTRINTKDCPIGTKEDGPGGACIGQYADHYFEDTLSPLQSSQVTFDQKFRVATKENIPGLDAFFGLIQIGAFHPNGATTSNSLDETQRAISINGDTGLQPNGSPIRTCH